MGRRLAITIALVLTTWMVSIETASACSCAPLKIDRETFRQSEGAMIGTFLERLPVSDQEADYRYRVDRVFRGRKRIPRGSVITIRSAANGAACGFETPVGEREGLFLGRSQGRWTGNLCSTAAPRKMRRAAKRAGFTGTANC